jgi:PhnB protein
MLIQPYLSFEGRSDEAIEFYKTALDAKVEMIMRFKDSPQKPPSDEFPPEIQNKVMHASLRIGHSTVMATDSRCTGKPNFAGITLTLAVSNDAEANRFFSALANGGTVTMPLAKTFFSSQFGTVTDRFGVPWMVLVQA